MKKMSRLIIIGASGHGRVVADIAKKIGYKDIFFLDDDERIKECAGYSVIGNTKEAPYGDLHIAIGNTNIRRRMMNKYKDRNFPILIHPNAIVSDDVEIGRGTVVMAGAVINTGTKIGDGCIINTCSSVDHDCIVKEYCHVSVGAHLCGTVTINENVWIGAGSTVINNINICNDCIIGAGAVVINNIDITGIYVGVPAILKKK